MLLDVLYKIVRDFALKRATSSEPVNQKKIKLIQGIGTYITKQKTVENLKG